MPEISYKNVPVHYVVQGKGRAVVLLHGFLENLSMWKELSEELSKKYKMVSIDLFGHGEYRKSRLYPYHGRAG